MKSLKPAHREKKRYIGYEIKGELFDIEKELKRVLGIYGMAEGGILFIKKGRKGIIRVNTSYVDRVRSAFIILSNKERNIRSITTSGVLRKVKMEVN